jgi:hypothetical protein
VSDVYKEIRSGEIMLRRLDEVQFASIHEDCLTRWKGKLPGSLGRGIPGKWDKAFFQRGSLSNSPTARFMGAFRVGSDQLKAKPGEPSKSSLDLVDELAKTLESTHDRKAAVKPPEDAKQSE